MPLTDDPNDPRLTRGVDDKPVPQAPVYLVLSEEERAKGFVRPVRKTYIHEGPEGPQFPARGLTNEEKIDFPQYVKFEDYPKGFKGSVTGRYWTQAQLDAVDKGCKSATTMGQALAETYARNPKFYGSTYCCVCMKHLPVSEFVRASEQSQRVGS